MNATLRLPKKQLEALTPAAVESYLRAHGWEADPALSTAKVGVYRRPGDSGSEVLVPRDPGFIDYALRLGDVVQALAAVERRTAWEVLEDLSGRHPHSSPNGPVSAPQGGVDTRPTEAPSDRA